MGLVERNEELLRRARDLTPIVPALREALEASFKRRMAAGIDARGVPFRALARATLKGRRPPGPPLAPAGSRIVSGAVLKVEPTEAGLAVSRTWPGVPFVKYHAAGAGRLPKRDPGGFSAEDKRTAARLLRERVSEGGKPGA